MLTKSKQSTDKHTRFTDILEKVAIANEPVGRARLAAMLVYKNEILSIGYNQYKTHPFQKKFAANAEAVFLHAENMAIYNARKLYSDDVISKSTMYIVRVKRPDDCHKSFVWGLAKPCAGCQRALATFDIKRVYYSTDEQSLDFL